jgi:DDE superfamily endonuclease
MASPHESSKFNKLLSYIPPELKVDELQSARQGGAILPEIRLYCMLRWLASGSYSNNSMFTGISKPSFYRLCWQTILAIYQCPDLKLHFPQSREECQIAAANFSAISRGKAIANCVSAIDRFLLEIGAPPRISLVMFEATTLGTTNDMVLILQACCDHLLHFTYIAVAGPGVMNDNQSIHQVDIGAMIECIPLGHCVIGDAAYTALEQFVPMYYGVDKLKPKYDNFNFFGSQLRIQIEMAFGMMTRKWGIYWRPLLIGLDKIKYVVESVARLHNFCINERILESGDNAIDPVAEANVTSREIFQDTAEAMAEYAALTEDLPGISAMHADMVNRIKYLGLSRSKLA